MHILLRSARNVLENSSSNPNPYFRKAVLHLQAGRIRGLGAGVLASRSVDLGSWVLVHATKKWNAEDIHQGCYNNIQWRMSKDSLINSKNPRAYPPIMHD